MAGLLSEHRRGWAAYAAFLALMAWFLYFHNASAAGLTGTDEPRYAQVSREMLESGDYITPHLLHAPWYEKPPLYYWFTAASFAVFGVNEAAARLPAALFAVGFLILFAWQTRRLFPGETARYAVPILLSSLGWIAFGRGASMEMLFSSTLAAALGFMAMWLWLGRRRWLFAFYGMLAFSVLAKGFGGIVLSALILAAYCVITRDYRWLVRVLNPWCVTFFSIITLPWLGAMYFKHGNTFIDEFIIKQHFRRYLTNELAHPGPWWYYLPLLVVGVFPWTAHLFSARALREVIADHRRVFLLSWIAVVMLFFSASQGKLPGYILVVLPAVTMWIAEEWKRATLWQIRAVGIVQALLLLALSSVLGSVPAAMARGITHATFRFTWLASWKSAAFVAAIATLIWLAWRGRRLAAILAASAITAGALLWLLGAIAPEIDRTASARPIAQVTCAQGFGIDGVGRAMRYGLEFYCNRAMTETPHEYMLSPTSPPGAIIVASFPDARLIFWRRPLVEKRNGR